MTWVPTAEAQGLAVGFDVEESPAVWGVSRAYLDTPAQLWAMKALILRSLEIVQAGKEDPAESGADKG